MRMKKLNAKELHILMGGNGNAAPLLPIDQDAATTDNGNGGTSGDAGGGPPPGG